MAPPSVSSARMDLTARDARWLALGAQGLARPRRATKAGRKQLLAVVEQLGAVQLDAVNVLERTQYVVLWSRVGNYDRAVFDALAQPMGPLFEGQTRSVAWRRGSASTTSTRQGAAIWRDC